MKSLEKRMMRIVIAFLSLNIPIIYLMWSYAIST